MPSAFIYDPFAQLDGHLWFKLRVDSQLVQLTKSTQLPHPDTQAAYSTKIDYIPKMLPEELESSIVCKIMKINKNQKKIKLENTKVLCIIKKNMKITFFMFKLNF